METMSRCNAHDVELQWWQAQDLKDCVLDARQHANLKRIVREAVSNALRHSQTSTLRVEIEANLVHLTLQISNDSVETGQESASSSGRGTHNIRSRTEELGGAARWLVGEGARLGGYTVVVEIPLKENACI